MITTSSGLAVIASSAITSMIFSRMNSSPCPEPYCMAWTPLVWISWSKDAPRSASGRSAMLGMPPASDTTSGRLATAKRARTADTVMEPVRSAYWSM